MAGLSQPVVAAGQGLEEAKAAAVENALPVKTVDRASQ